MSARTRRARFFVACSSGDVARVAEAMKTAAMEIDEVCVTTGAAIATTHGHVDVLSLLVTSREQANRPIVPSKDCRDAMLGLEHGVSPGLYFAKGRTLLMHACVSKEHACAAHLLACHADVDATDIVTTKLTALVMCCTFGETNLATLLIDNGASVDGPRHTFCPTVVAARNGRVGCVRLLLERGATLDPPRKHAIRLAGGRIESMVLRAKLLRKRNVFSLDWTPCTHKLFPLGDREDLSKWGLAVLRVTRARRLPDDVALQILTVLARMLEDKNWVRC
mgnify:CR=1 FL=1